MGSSGGLSSVDASRASESLQRRIHNLLSLARDGQDRLRVVVDSPIPSGSLVGVDHIKWGNNNTAPLSYSTGSANSMDAREQHRTAARAVVQAARNRWTIS